MVCEKVQTKKIFFQKREKAILCLRVCLYNPRIVATKKQEEITTALLEMSEGKQGAAKKLLPIVYDELRRLAASYLKLERPDHTLQPTALVHEAYIRLIDQTNVDWKNRTHFFSVAAGMMRRVLVDHARKHKAEKRGGHETKIALDDAVSFPQSENIDVIAVDDALFDLAKLDPQQSRIVELRFFGGLTLDEVAEVMNISRSTVKREWNMARAWLYDELNK